MWRKWPLRRRKMILWFIGIGVAIIVVGVVAFAHALKSTGEKMQKAVEQSPLAKAVNSGDCKKARQLIEHGARADERLNLSYRFKAGGEVEYGIAVPLFGGDVKMVGVSLLLAAAMQDSQEMLHLLIEHGA